MGRGFSGGASSKKETLLAGEVHSLGMEFSTLQGRNNLNIHLLRVIHWTGAAPTNREKNVIQRRAKEKAESLHWVNGR